MLDYIIRDKRISFAELLHFQEELFILATDRAMGLPKGHPLTALITIPESKIVGIMTTVNPTEDPGTLKERKWER